MYLSIVYKTEFHYPEPVRQSHNELRAAPTTNRSQRLLSYRLATSPASRPFHYSDYWGTMVDAFGVSIRHEILSLTVDAVVETQDLERDQADSPVSALEDPRIPKTYWEYLQATNHVQLTDEVRKMAGEELAEASSCRDLLGRLSDRTHDRLDYRAGSTRIGESISAILDKGAGVCQDYAHLMVAMCRSVGIPARYVSGYLYATDHSTGEAGKSAVAPGAEDGAGDAVRVQTHAWVEALVPAGDWVAMDPTNRLDVGMRHVKIGAGRDYDDVTPLRGIYTGGATPELRANVEIRRLVDPPPQMLAASEQQFQQQQ